MKSCLPIWIYNEELENLETAKQCVLISGRTEKSCKTIRNLNSQEMILYQPDSMVW